MVCRRNTSVDTVHKGDTDYDDDDDDNTVIINCTQHILEFFIDIILPPPDNGPGVDSASNRNEY
jgi:hypothetical protein